jgi:Cu2+-exporting ATPase
VVHPEHPPEGPHDRHRAHRPETFRTRFLITTLLTVPLLALTPEVPRLVGLPPLPVPGAGFLVAALATVIYLVGGLVFVQGAWDELRAGRPGMMTLIGLAVTVAYFYSLAVTLGLPGHPFYWELATLIDVMLLGHWLELVAVQQAGQALERLVDLLPPVAHRLVDERIEDVPVGALQPGDHILIRPGEQVPADGVVVVGESAVNEAFLTGESRPVPKRPGDEVVAGSVNTEGVLTVRVTRVGTETTLFQIVRLVRAAQAARSRYQALADRAAFVLTLVALGGGLLTFLVWVLVGADATFAITRSVTVMVIACPHALGLAIPLVVVEATGLAARNGLLIRNREAFERGYAITRIALDKTGTLTEGRFVLRDLTAVAITPEQALAVAAALERHSEHPLARAIVAAAEERGLALPAVAEVHARPGRGVEGLVEGVRYRVGRPEWLAEAGLTFPPDLVAALTRAEERGDSPIVLWSDRPLAVFALADQIRPSARVAVRALQEMGIAVVMVTGDAEAVARTVARELGIAEYYARVLPPDKAALVERWRAAGERVAFVGDGINDAPALVAADLGVAIGAGTNIAIESADVVLVENDPLDVVRLLRLARVSYQKMVQNLLWATAYNAVALPLAAGVAARWGLLLPPAIGALLMSLSTIIVALNALLLRRARLA